MPHEFLIAEKVCKFLYDNKYTTICYQRCCDDFQNMVVIKACLLHAGSNKRLINDHPLMYKKMKSYIDSINLKYFVKNYCDRKRFNV